MPIPDWERRSILSESSEQPSSSWVERAKIAYIKEALTENPIQSGAIRIVRALHIPLPKETVRAIKRREQLVKTARHVSSLQHSFEQMFGDIEENTPHSTVIVHAVAEMSPHKMTLDRETLTQVEEHVTYCERDLLYHMDAVTIQNASGVLLRMSDVLHDITDVDNPINAPLSQQEKDLFTLAAITGSLPLIPPPSVLTLSPGIIRGLFQFMNIGLNRVAGIKEDQIYPPFLHTLSDLRASPSNILNAITTLAYWPQKAARARDIFMTHDMSFARRN